MERRFLKELGANAAVAAVVFAWIFGQSPLPGQLNIPEVAAEPALQQQSGKRGDQVPLVQQASTKDIRIRIEPTAAPAPLPGLYAQTQAKLLKVAATKLKMRAKPSSQSNTMRIYPNGSAFEQIGQNGKWLQVRHIENGTSGWMHGDYLQVTN